MLYYYIILRFLMTLSWNQNLNVKCNTNQLQNPEYTALQALTFITQMQEKIIHGHKKGI